jgi:mannose-6-phosphate isomerase-like protein (cupin superfamily)
MARDARDMADYTKQNLREDVEDMAPRFGYAPNVEARFARKPLALANSGVSYFRIAPGFRLPFGHRHGEQEEIYLVISGSARVKAGDDIVELAELDAIRVPGETPRAMEGGPEGAEVIAFGAPNTDNKDAEMLTDFWPPEEDE